MKSPLLVGPNTFSHPHATVPAILPIRGAFLRDLRQEDPLSRPEWSSPLLIHSSSGTSLVAQWLGSACRCRGHRFNPWFGDNSSCLRVVKPMHHNY